MIIETLSPARFIDGRLWFLPFPARTMKLLDQYSLNELKLVYLCLHAALPGDPELMDSELLQDLQTYLQRMARAADVDVSHHAQWATWLNNGVLLKRV